MDHRLLTVLDLPGEGSSVSVNVDRAAILDIIKKEIAPLIADPLQGRKPPANQPSTVRRKGGKNTPLRDTGRLLDDIIAISDDDGIKIYIMNYYFYQKKKYRLLFHTKDIVKAIDRARAKIAQSLIRIS